MKLKYQEKKVKSDISMGCDYLIVDATNLLYRTYFANKDESGDIVNGLATHNALVTLNKYYKKFKPAKKMILCFDEPSWRKEYTQSDRCISGKIYKATRRQTMTESQKLKYANFIEHIREFRNLLRNYTSIVVLSGDKLEADDLISGSISVIQATIDSNSDFIIVSSDKDMIQLISERVKLINPADDTERTLDEWNNDSKLFIFEKCIRGDIGDNVQSAFPGCRRKKILEAYSDPYAFANLMGSDWSRIDGETFKVSELYNENKLLMDLTHQPDDIQKKIIETVTNGVVGVSKFSYFHFLKYVGKYKLLDISNNIDSYVPMLSH